MDKKTLIKKAQGCLVGLACGDAMGDLGRSDLQRQRYGIVTDIYEDAGSTDDTEFAIFSAKILIDCQGLLTEDAILAGWQKYILNEGGLYERGGKPLYGAVENLRRNVLPPFSGQFNVNHNDDGAAMRAAPFGIISPGNHEKAAELAAMDAQVSHYADGIWASQAVAASIAAAMGGASISEALDTGLSYIPNDNWLGFSMDRAMKMCDQFGSIESAWQPLHTELWTPTHAMAAEALPQIYSILRLTGGDFYKSMFWGCNFGRDADTIGAIIGAISGAIHGIDVIHPHWIERVRHPSGVCIKFSDSVDIMQLAMSLCDLI